MGISKGLLSKMIRKTIRRLPPAPSTNYLYREFTVNPYHLLPPNAVIYDIGARDARGHYSFGPPPAGAKLVCVDLVPGPGVDIVADAQDLYSIKDASADCVLAVGLLLHCENPQQAVDEFLRILKPGGILYLSVPFVLVRAQIPGIYDPNVYFHFTIEGVEILARNFVKLQSGFNRGPASSVCEILIVFLAILFSFNSRRLFLINRYVFGWLLFWVKY